MNPRWPRRRSDLPAFFGPFDYWNLASIVIAAMPQDLPNSAGVSIRNLECGRT
ncbi:MAG: hypothetical protein R3E82_16240 [Pseudomonadales bacterium]|jgi:hypothetical protein